MGHEKDKNVNQPGRPARWVIVYNNPSGKAVTEPGGEDRATSKALRIMREDAVANGTWAPRKSRGTGGNMPFWEYELLHNARRIAQGKALAVDGTEHGFMKNHVLPRIGEVPMLTFGGKHGREIIRKLIAALRTETDLAPHTITNIYGQLHVLFTWAILRDKVCSANPCTLLKMMDELPSKETKNPRFRQLAMYTKPELVALLTHPRIPPDRHMVYALEFLGMMRIGEAAGRRWMDWDATHEPLGLLHVITQYDDDPTKTRRPRAMPVHPVLAAMLHTFRTVWWPILYGRRPTPEDFIVPVRGRGKARADAPRPCRNKRTVYAQLQRDLEMLGFRRRRQHDLRRAGISYTRGGNKMALRACTHGEKPSDDIIDLYTNWPWEDLCAAVSCLKFELPEPTPESRHLQLVGLDPRASRQRGSRGGASRDRYGDTGRQGRRPKTTSLAAQLTTRNHSQNTVTPTGIESVINPAEAPVFVTQTRTSGPAGVSKKAPGFAAADEPGTPNGSAPMDLLDLGDALGAGAMRLRLGKATSHADHAELARLLDRTRRELETLTKAAEAQATTKTGRSA